MVGWRYAITVTVDGRGSAVTVTVTVRGGGRGGEEEKEEKEGEEEGAAVCGASMARVARADESTTLSAAAGGDRHSIRGANGPRLPKMAMVVRARRPAHAALKRKNGCIAAVVLVVLVVVEMNTFCLERRRRKTRGTAPQNIAGCGSHWSDYFPRWFPGQ
jgi:hypothetical protein